jgi:glutaminase
LAIPSTIEPQHGWISTGELPPPAEVQRLLDQTHARYRAVDEGEVADYIPALASVDPNLFGLALAGVGGRVYETGDTEVEFTIQSVSKPFAFALICELLGPNEARSRLGVNGTGLPFDSVIAVELHPDRRTNPLVNSGAIATTSLAAGITAEERWTFLHRGLSAFAGRDLHLDDEVYESEMASNHRNLGIARLLTSYGRMYCDPEQATELYTRQCSLRVTARDLAIMGATLANGGTNPVTGTPVISADTCVRVLAVMATAGLYEQSGNWLYEIGLPGKSGVGGGIVTVSPGKGGCGSFSPPLDAAGNSVRGQLATRYLSTALGLNLFASGAQVNDYRASEGLQMSTLSGDFEEISDR